MESVRQFVQACGCATERLFEPISKGRVALVNFLERLLDRECGDPQIAGRHGEKPHRGSPVRVGKGRPGTSAARRADLQPPQDNAQRAAGRQATITPMTQGLFYMPLREPRRFPTHQDSPEGVV